MCFINTEETIIIYLLYYTQFILSHTHIASHFFGSESVPCPQPYIISYFQVIERSCINCDTVNNNNCGIYFYNRNNNW